jgi:hypothetical protein
MKLLDLLYEQSSKRRLIFLLAGGHAVNAYVTGRQTGDIDLVVPLAEKKQWKELVLSLRYSLHFEQGAFLQFRPPEPGWWPLDLILVDEATFDQMKQEAVAVDFGGAHRCLVVSPSHLIAMKCHAAKQPGRDDPVKDIRDIVELAKHVKLDLTSDEFAALCMRYGNEELLRKIRAVS